MAKSATADRLREGLAKEALEKLDWPLLESHLANLDLSTDAVSELLSHIRRNNDFLIRRTNPKREAARASFLEDLARHLSDRLGNDAVSGLQNLVALITLIEDGYSEIMRTQGNTVAAKMLPETQASAALARAEFAYRDLASRSGAALKRKSAISPQSMTIRLDDGSDRSPDAILTGIVDMATMTLMLLGHSNRWFKDSFLALPDPVEPTEDEKFKAGLTELLAASWAQWERVEQRCRYFGGDLQEHLEGSLPAWAPEGARKALEYDHLTQAELFDHFANARLSERMVQTFQEMSMQTNMTAKAAGIAAAVGLPPGTFVSAVEAHAGVMLSQTLGYSIVDDVSQPCGLRLVEWLRGYAALRCIAEDHVKSTGLNGSLVWRLSRASLVQTLERVGLRDGSAETFIDNASLRISSRDLFDQPLIRLQNTDLLLFGPGILDADPGRVTLSAIGNRGEQLDRKGKAFEADILRFFSERQLNAKTFKFTRGGEEFEFDVVLPWGDHVFIFECKNRTLSGNNPIAAFNFARDMDSAIGQVSRLAAGMAANPDAVLERSGIDVIGKKIVPCVLNSLPYALKGDRDGVYVTDASSLRRFFDGRYFNVVRPHRVSPRKTIAHRIPLKCLWAGEIPTSEDLVAYLNDPLQLQIMFDRVEGRTHVFGLGERTVVAARALSLKEMSTVDLARLFSVDNDWIDSEAKAVTAAIRKAKAKSDSRALRAADRAWRKRR